MAEVAIGGAQITFWIDEEQNGLIGTKATFHIDNVPKLRVASLLLDLAKQLLDQSITETAEATPASRVLSGIMLPPGVNLN